MNVIQPEDAGPDRYGAVTAPAAAASADTTSTAAKRSFKEMGFGSDDSSDEEDNDISATTAAAAAAGGGEHSDGTAHPTAVPQATVPPAAVTLAKKASMKGIGFSRSVCVCILAAVLLLVSVVAVV
jgi:hypothetical protein